MVEDPSSVSRPLPSADLTPENDEILHESGIEPIGGMTPSKRNTALLFTGPALVLGILWVNSGTSQQASNRDLTPPGGAAQERPDSVLRATFRSSEGYPTTRPPCPG